MLRPDAFDSEFRLAPGRLRAAIAPSATLACERPLDLGLAATQAGDGLALTGHLVDAALATQFVVEVLDGVGEMERGGRPPQPSDRASQRLPNRAVERLAAQAFVQPGSGATPSLHSARTTCE